MAESRQGPRRPGRDEPERAVARESLGRAIRALRQTQSRTLADVAARAGISVSLLSQVERGLADPSLDSLRDIAIALDTTPFKLLEDGHVRSHIIRRGEGLRLSLPETEVTYELLSPSSEGAFQVAKSRLEAGASSARAPRVHPGEEAAFVLEGSVTLEIGSETIELEAGDCATYDPRVPHRAIASGDGPVTVLYVVSPPTL